MVSKLLYLCSDSDKLLHLMEIFPDYSKADVLTTLQTHKGNMSQCIQALLETTSCDGNQKPMQTEKKCHNDHLRKDLPCVEDDGHLKNAILSKYVDKFTFTISSDKCLLLTPRYAFVDTKEDKRSHRPCIAVQVSVPRSLADTPIYHVTLCI